jgi:hypothetical protein
VPFASTQDTKMSTGETDAGRVSDEDLLRFIKDSAFEIPFQQDRNSDGRIKEIANYYAEVTETWPWIQDSFQSAILTGAGSVT